MTAKAATDREVADGNGETADTTEERAWSVREAAALVGLTAHTLRYYEREGLLLPVTRGDSSGHRRYTARDLAGIVFITRLRATGMPIRQVREYVALVRAGDGTMEARRVVLEAHRETVCRQIAELEDSLNLIERKIASYLCSSPEDLMRELAAKITRMTGRENVDDSEANAR
jgi:DNA-binding transcriptional MerR regulator